MPTIKPQQVVTDQFNSSYWSGSQLYVYFNNIYIPEIVAIQYMISEQVLPIFAYGDYNYRFAARGLKTISGAFSINYQRSFYIKTVLEAIKNKVVSNSNPTNSTSNLSSVANPQSVEEILSMIQTGDKSVNKNVLDQIQQKAQAQFWNATSPVSTYAANTPLFNSAIDGFTIYLKFGDPSSLNQGEIDSNNNKNIKQPGTIEALLKTQIMSTGKSIDDSGHIVLENYSFMSSSIEYS